MEVLPNACCDNLKRYMKRRMYQRLSAHTHPKRKLRISRLGGSGTTTTTTRSRIRRIPKLHLKISISPIKLLAKFHKAYVAMMVCLSNKMDINGAGLFRGKKVAKRRHVSMVSSGEEVDSRLVMEIYKRLAASGKLSTVL